MKKQITEYTVIADIGKKIKFDVASDLHDCPYDGILNGIKNSGAEMTLIPGDLMNKRGTPSDNGLGFLNEVSRLMPTFYSTGNHDIPCDEDIALIKKTNAVFLYNSFVSFGGINIGGLASGFRISDKQGHLKKTPPPDIDFLNRFSNLEGFKLLLCHHPEYYKKYIAPLPIDLTVSGHAHGGQIRWRGGCFFAPGQGFLPKYTSGVTENRLVVSRGLSNQSRIPRINNEPELVIITVAPREYK